MHKKVEPDKKVRIITCSIWVWASCITACIIRLGNEWGVHCPCNARCCAADACFDVCNIKQPAWHGHLPTSALGHLYLATWCLRLGTLAVLHATLPVASPRYLIPACVARNCCCDRMCWKHSLLIWSQVWKALYPFSKSRATPTKLGNANSSHVPWCWGVEPRKPVPKVAHTWCNLYSAGTKSRVW